jgi:hypothetical protein
MNELTNDLDPTDAHKIWKPESGIRKLGGSDIEWYSANQATHFTCYIKSLDVENSSYNHLKK